MHTYKANVNLSEQTVEKKIRMCIIMDVLSLKVIAPNLLAAVGVLNVNPRNYIRENHSQLFTEQAYFVV